MKLQDIERCEVYHTGYARDCERVHNYGKNGPNTWAIQACGREANYERTLIAKDGFRVTSALCEEHAKADLERWLNHLAILEV